MFNSKYLIMVVTLLVLLAAFPVMAMDSGSAKFNVIRPLLVDGVAIEAGRYEVSWQSGSEEAEVTFMPAGKKTGEITVEGKIEQVDKEYDYNALAIGKDASGNEIIKQLQFSGTNVRIVFN